MESRYSVRWVRRSGETIAIEMMRDLELGAARHALEREDVGDPVAAALLEAVADELNRRATHANPAADEREATRRAA